MNSMGTNLNTPRSHGDKVLFTGEDGDVGCAAGVAIPLEETTFQLAASTSPHSIILMMIVTASTGRNNSTHFHFYSD